MKRRYAITMGMTCLVALSSGIKANANPAVAIGPIVSAEMNLLNTSAPNNKTATPEAPAAKADLSSVAKTPADKLSEKVVPGVSDLDTKGLPDAATALYAQGLNETPDGWHFSYGPVHSEGNKSAVYFAKARNGSIIISCGSTGSAEMIFGLAGAYTETGLDDIADFSVGDKSHDLRVRAAKNPPNAVETVYYATGLDVLGIIKTMAALNSTQQVPHVINISIKDRHMALPSPWPAGNAREMFALCAGWYDKHFQTAK